MVFDAPQDIVYDVPTSNFAVSAAVEASKKNKEPVCVQAFGQAPDYGIKEPNTVVYFYELVTKTINSRIARAKFAGINPQSHSSWCLYVRGQSSVTVEFNLSQSDLTDDLALYLIHLSSDIHNGRYDSGIRIFVNGQVLVNKYVPPSHDWIFDDRFDLSTMVRDKVLHPGTNTIEIQLHEDARANYWLHKLMVK